MEGDIPYPVVDEATYHHHQLGEIVSQVFHCTEIQSRRGLHKNYEQFEYVERCPPVHWYLHLRHRLGQCLVRRKWGQMVRILGGVIVMII